MSGKRIFGSAVLSVAIVSALLAPPAARADEVADFYRGNTIDLIISTGPGGLIDVNGRTLLRHMVKYIPGKPDYVAKNMPGAGHVRAANYLYNVAPKDGTAIGALVRNFVLHQALGGKGVRYDVRDFRFLGATSYRNVAITVWHTTGVKTIEQARKKEIIVGGTGVGSGTVIFPTILNALVGTKFKIVQGYKSGGNIDLAMERGEVFGRAGASFGYLEVVTPEYLSKHKLNILAQIGLERESGYPDVPLVTELVTNPDARKVLELYSSIVAVGVPIFTTPGVPKARLAALRQAFDKTMKDPAYLADAKKARIEIKPIPADKLTRTVNSVVDAPPKIIELAKSAVRREGLVKCTEVTSAKFCRTGKRKRKKKTN